VQLPIEKILPELRSTLLTHRNAVLTADPGAGKTTRVPVSLLNEPWLADKKIIILEPRRLAAQRSAIFMAEQLNERAGQTIGYRIRGDNKVSAVTRIEVVTEGILTRMLQDDPTLSDIAIVIFDEFHERSIHADLGLALTLDVQHHLREDLRILVMSATLDGLTLSTLMYNSPVITSEGRTFPVDTHYLSQNNTGKIEPLIVSTILRSLRNDTGDILVFLPGQREIKRVESLLAETDFPEHVDIHLLYGEASSEKQRAALTPALSGRRKVILSTSVAETSLTIDNRFRIIAGLEV
jgi:ATP-dependent helicase HrpB